MATVTALTKERMLEIEAASVVGGVVTAGHLILTKFDGSTIDAGSVIGPTGSPGVTQAQLDTFMGDHMPVGVSVEYNGTVVPNSKWLFERGQTVANAQTLYPALWAIIPASMKSGSSMIMPDSQSKVTIGLNPTDTDYDTMHETGGSKTHTLTQAELPAVGVTVNPPATSFTVDPPNTTVTINDPGHSHLDLGSGTMFWDIANGAGTTRQFNNTLNRTTGITATVDIAPFSASVDIAQFTSGNMGSGAAMAIVQPYIVKNKIMKVL